MGSVLAKCCSPKRPGDYVQVNHEEAKDKEEEFTYLIQNKWILDKPEKFVDATSFLTSYANYKLIQVLVKKVTFLGESDRTLGFQARNRAGS